MAPSVNKVGLWGKTTSTLDWCEENYAVTENIAEFWNTISNVMMIIPPFLCSIYFWKNNVEKRHIFSNLCLLAVGIGSWMFHMTLWYEMQLMDELPMIYGTCVFLYSLHQHAKPKHEKNGFYIFIMSVISITVTVVYLLWPNPIFHQTSYATLVFVLIYEAIIAWTNFPQIKHIAFTSLGFYICGFIFWSIDNALCSNLRTMRSDSEPYSLIRASTQLHAWWHIFTGYATYLHILLSTYARQLYLKRSCSYKKLCGVWPYIEIGSKE